MALIRNYTDPSGADFPQAYEWIIGLALDFMRGDGGISTAIHPTAADAAAGRPPIAFTRVDAGSVEFTGQSVDVTNPDGSVTTTPATVQFPGVQQIISDNQAAFDSIRAYLYGKMMLLPSRAGAVEAP